MSDPVRETVFEWFKDVVREVWSNGEKIVPTLVLSPEEPRAVQNESPLASLSYSQKPTAVGKHLIVFNKVNTLRLSNRLLAMPPDDIRKILIHEAVHIGYSNHGVEFRAIVREHGGSVSESSLERGGGVLVQKKVGARYQTVKTFEDEHAALAWGREQQRAEPGSRYRVDFGELDDLEHE